MISNIIKNQQPENQFSLARVLHSKAHCTIKPLTNFKPENQVQGESIKHFDFKYNYRSMHTKQQSRMNNYSSTNSNSAVNTISP